MNDEVVDLTSPIHDDFLAILRQRGYEARRAPGPISLGGEPQYVIRPDNQMGPEVTIFCSMVETVRWDVLFALIDDKMTTLMRLGGR